MDLYKKPRAVRREDFGELLLPHEAVEPILARPVRAALTEWLTEIWASDALAAVGLKARQRAMFSGKPGTGKTTLAHHLAARLGLPMLAVRPEEIISRWVGATAENIGALFTVARGTPPGQDADGEDGEPPCLLFFDEFDAIAATRKRAEQASEQERNAYVNTLLQRIEQHDGLIVAATNFPEHIDPAIWRRFDFQIALELPGAFERREILKRYLSPYGLPLAQRKLLAEALETASPALIRQFCEGIKRQLVIGPLLNWDMRREAVISRVLTAVGPHPDLGKPRLWSLGVADEAVRAMDWPLRRASEIVDGEGDVAPQATEAKIVRLSRGKT